MAPVWWVVAVSPVGMLASGKAAVAATGQDVPAVAGFARFSGTPAVGFVSVLLLVTFVGALGEEVGGRGYALPHRSRHGHR